MTVIAWRWGTLAGDSLETSDRGIVVGYQRKVFKHANGWLSGAAGDASDCNAFRKAVGDGALLAFRASDDNFGGIAVNPLGEATAFWDKSLSNPIHADFYSIGAGRELAMGALACGASAEQAVGIAIKYSVWCGGDIHAEHLDA